uniref:Growth factor receptor domain-containing protein n=1 Tax=Gouania willdenowi TaxID=441366 RepID=A0A8C5GSX6_GOUWI
MDNAFICVVILVKPYNLIIRVQARPTRGEYVTRTFIKPRIHPPVFRGIHFTPDCVHHLLSGGQCMKECPKQSFGDPSGWRCQLCHSSCQTCHGTGPTECELCLGGTPSLHGQCPQVNSCKANCPMGYYEDMDEGRCGQCHPTCGGCSGPLQDDCESCSTFSPMLFNGACYKDCPTGTYYEAFTCMGCHPHCYSCEGPGRDECQACAVPKYLQNGTCVSECPSGTYTSRQEASGRELGFCLPCDHVCSTCSGASPRDCVTCSTGYLRLLHLCVAHCPTGYWPYEYHISYSWKY